jgi:hypothetical protein
VLNDAAKGKEPVLIPTVPCCHNCSFYGYIMYQLLRTSDVGKKVSPNVS